MYKSRALLISVVIITLTFTKAASQQAIVTSGGDINGIGGSVSYSVGQPDYTNFTDGGGSVSLGVQQPLVIIMVGTNEITEDFEISVYPNPFNTQAILKLASFKSEIEIKNLSYELHDINGKLISNGSIHDTETIFSMKEFSSGMYLLNVIRDGSEIKTFKIFKSN